mgnify:CR=1 FL=1
MADARVSRWTFGGLRKAPEATVSEGLELVVEGGGQVSRRNVASTGQAYSFLGVIPLGSGPVAKAVTLGGASAIVQAVAVVGVVAAVAVVSVGAASGWDFDFSSNSTNATVVAASPAALSAYEPEPAVGALEHELDRARVL